MASLQCHSRCRLSWITCLNRRLARLFYSHRLTLMTERAEENSGISFDDFGLRGRDVLLCEVTASGATSSAADAFRRRA